MDTTLSYNMNYGNSGGNFNNGNSAATFCTTSFVWNPSTSRSFYRFNGNTIGAFVFNLSTLNVGTQFYLGGSVLGAGQAFRAFIGDYAEFIYYNSALPSSQIQIVEGYLAWKWGIESRLNSNHPYRFITPSSYDFSSPT